MKIIQRINKYPKNNKTIKAQERSHSSDESKLHYPSTRKIGLVLHREKRKIKIWGFFLFSNPKIPHFHNRFLLKYSLTLLF